MPFKNMLELNRLALLAETLEAAVLPTLAYLVSGTPALGAVFLEHQPEVQSPESALYLERADQGSGGGVGLLRRPVLAQRYQARSTFGTAPSTELLEVMVGSLDSLHAPLVAASSAGQTLALALERDPTGQPSVVLGLYTFLPYGLPSEAEERFLMIAEELAPLFTRLYREKHLEHGREQAYRSLGMTLELRGTDPVGHTDRVAALCVRLGRVLGYSGEALQGLRWGAYLHDLGMLGIPDAILNKRGKLALHEWQILHLHPQDGLRFASGLGDLPEATRRLILDHHEHWDGSGYPRGLRGSEISLEGRMFAVVDAFDALTSTRPYRAGVEPYEALEEIAVRSAGHFDPAVVEAFVSLFERHTR